jgi:hypothetical protein
MSSAKALNAILPQIAAGQAYEAHQKARTFAARYAKSNQPAVAIDVLFQSARELLKAGQPGSGADLANFMLEVYESADVKVDDEARGACARGTARRRGANLVQDGSRSSSRLSGPRALGASLSSTNPLRACARFC